MSWRRPVSGGISAACGRARGFGSCIGGVGRRRDSCCAVWLLPAMCWAFLVRLVVVCVLPYRGVRVGALLVAIVCVDELCAVVSSLLSLSVDTAPSAVRRCYFAPPLG